MTTPLGPLHRDGAARFFQAIYRWQRHISAQRNECRSSQANWRNQSTYSRTTECDTTRVNGFRHEKRPFSTTRTPCNAQLAPGEYHASHERDRTRDETTKVEVHRILGAEKLGNEFKNVLRHVPNPVFLVTTKVKVDGDTVGGRGVRDRFRGVTVSSLTTVTLVPIPVICLNITKTSRTLAAMERLGAFRVHILAANEIGATTADLFTRPYENPAAPFHRLIEATGCHIRDHGNGPVLKSEGILSSFDCRILNNGILDVGDHKVILAEVHGTEIGTSELSESIDPEEDTRVSLAYAQRAYRSIGEKITPLPDVPSTVSQHKPERSWTTPSFTSTPRLPLQAPMQARKYSTTTRSRSDYMISAAEESSPTSLPERSTSIPDELSPTSLPEHQTLTSDESSPTSFAEHSTSTTAQWTPIREGPTAQKPHQRHTWRGWTLRSPRPSPTDPPPDLTQTVGSFLWTEKNYLGALQLRAKIRELEKANIRTIREAMAEVPPGGRRIRWHLHLRKLIVDLHGAVRKGQMDAHVLEQLIQRPEGRPEERVEGWVGGLWLGRDGSVRRMDEYAFKHLSLENDTAEEASPDDLGRRSETDRDWAREGGAPVQKFDGFSGNV